MHTQSRVGESVVLSNLVPEDSCTEEDDCLAVYTEFLMQSKIKHCLIDSLELSRFFMYSH